MNVGCPGGALLNSCLIKGDFKMTQLTRFDTAALNRALIGFDNLFDTFETRFAHQISNNYPPYNIEKCGENQYNIVVAVAGFSKEEVAVEIEGDQLTIRGEKAINATDAEHQVEYLHRGLAFRDFERRFTLAEHMEIKSAEIKNGVLTIQIDRIVPEAYLPRKIEVTEVK
jgi:molecular chaperone IbpA